MRADCVDLLVYEADDEPDGPEHEPPARQNSVSIAHVARTPGSDTVSEEQPQPSDQGEQGGRCGTRTHDLSRVKAAL
jgi:hypothetical protein